MTYMLFDWIVLGELAVHLTSIIQSGLCLAAVLGITDLNYYLFRNEFLVSKVLEEKADDLDDGDVKIQGFVTNIVIDETDYDFEMPEEENASDALLASKI